MNASMNRLAALLAGMFAIAVLVTASYGDPLTGRDILKFSQKPMDGTPITTADGTVQRYWGHDQLSTAYSQTPFTTASPTPYRGTFMADDFADRFSSPVVHVRWWGSYLDNIINPLIPVDKFLISFERDIPAGPNQPFSRPGEPILSQIVKRGPLAPGSGTFTETLVSPGGPPAHERLFEYNAELHLGKEFFQEPDTVYWLKIVALVDLPAGLQIDPFNPPAFVPRWGWHNRDYTIQNSLASTAPAVVPGEHIDGFLGPMPGGTPIWHFQDDAVTGRVSVDHLSQPMFAIMPRIEQFEFRPTQYLSFADGPQAIGRFSKDLAFELYTVPEPAAALLVMIGTVGILALRRRGA